MIRRRGGRPGLLGLAARTAVVTKTAATVQNRAAQRQAEQAVAPPQQPVVQPGGANLSDEIARLAELHAQGALTDEEFTAAKQSLLS